MVIPRLSRPRLLLLLSLLTLTVWLPPRAGSAAPLKLDAGTKVLGWSSDGQHLVWLSSAAVGSAPKRYFLKKGSKRARIRQPEKLPESEQALLEVEDGDDDRFETHESASLAVLHAVRTGEEKRFLLSYKALTYEGRSKGELKKKLGDLPDAAAFAAWRKEHPLVWVPGRKGPRGGRAEITVKAEGDAADAADATWKRNTLRWSVMGEVHVTLGAARGKDRGVETFEQGIGATYTPTWSATPYWEPSGRRVAFLLEEDVEQTMRGPDGGNIEVHVVPCAPRVEVLANVGQEAATGKAAEAVERVGFAVVATGAAKTPRAASVVYAAEGHAEAAAQIAAAIPGGATVEKLTWRPKAEVVVALGDSAR